jgi:SAM-dependent methyltransferase
MAHDLKLVSHCRLSGESLADAEILFELADCPVPGIYPETAERSVRLRTPLRVVQAQKSGFVQLAHEFDSTLYQQYAFAGGGSGAYRKHLEFFAQLVRSSFPLDAAILEVGCGDGWLLRRLRQLGYTNVLGIDPSRAAKDQETDFLVSGYFPVDLPATHQDRCYDLIFSRHVLEHIETPRAFVAGMVARLSTSGQVWIEVPDLVAALKKQLWGNFYQLHCNYFDSVTLDNLMSEQGLALLGGQEVDVFGGSILRRYQHSVDTNLEQARRLSGIGAQVSRFRNALDALASKAPSGCVGYGAAERTAVTLGYSSALGCSIDKLYDGNLLLSGRYLAGTSLPILHRDQLYGAPPAAILLFALSNAREILADWKLHLPLTTPVAVVGRDDDFRSLEDQA